MNTEECKTCNQTIENCECYYRKDILEDSLYKLIKHTMKRQLTPAEKEENIYINHPVFGYVEFYRPSARQKEILLDYVRLRQNRLRSLGVILILSVLLLVTNL